MAGYETVGQPTYRPLLAGRELSPRHLLVIRPRLKAIEVLQVLKCITTSEVEVRSCENPMAGREGSSGSDSHDHSLITTTTRQIGANNR
jgi:hypothetical protein